MKRPRPYWRDSRSAKPPEQKSDLTQKFLLNPAAVIAILTAVLYFQGQALYSGYLSYWGLNTQIFPLSFEDTLTQGAWSYLLVGIDNWRYLAGIAIYFIILYGVVFLLLFKRPMTLIRKIIHTKRINGVQKQVIDEATDRFGQLCLTFGAVLMIFLISILSWQKGKALAEAGHKRLYSSDEASQPFNSVTLKYLGELNQPTIVSGALIQSSSTIIAVHADIEDLLLVPMSRVISIQYHGEAKMAKAELKAPVTAGKE